MLKGTPESPAIRAVLKRVRIRPGSKVRIADHDSAWVPGHEFRELEFDEIKDRAKEVLKRSVDALADAQELLWASDNHAVLLVFQAMDAAGKDGTIKHVTSGLNPAGCEVHNFKAPTAEELDHPFLWRIMKVVPERGKIGIFNRSHYEDVLAVRVHPHLLANCKLHTEGRGEELWKQRYEDINAFEQHLSRNGTVILKFFLNVSKEEQRQRLLARLDDPHKNWKFTASDMESRERWTDYMRAYQAAIRATSTPWAPWHIIPADHKWVMRAMVAAIVTHTIRSLDLRFPRVSGEQKRELERARQRLMGKRRK